MTTYKLQILTLVKRISLLCLIFSLSRLLFYLFNTVHFQNLEAEEIFSVFFYGLRFDIFSIMVCNSLFILLSIIPSNFIFNNTYQKILKRLFIISNSIFLSFNFIDMAYFRFIGKRSTFDLFNQIGGQTDVIKQLPYYLRDFWLIIVLFIITIFILTKFYPKLKIVKPEYIYSKKNIISYSLSIIIICSLTVLSLRGGIQRVPIDFADAGNYAKPQHVSLVLNSSFTLIKSFSRQVLEEYSFFSLKTAFNSILPVKHYKNKIFKKQNVVFIILEGFSKEYTGIGHRKSITPFLDSLMLNSLVFTNAWANGTKSIEGIPAILASIPSLNNDPFINSPYCSNTINSMASVLKTKGYKTAFFHGGINGTMNFDVFAKQSGFDNYYGKNEYNNENDFDGNWGIWDEPYLNYCAKTIEKFSSPFFASIFTLSSHHPYKIPEKLAGKFPKTDLENSESIGYADYALRKFFETASKMNWFAGTLFVLTADHTSISSDPFYANTLGQHAIPIIFYKQDGSYKGINNRLIQHIDIMPSVLDTLGFSEPFFSFGKSIFSDKSEDYALFYDSGSHFLVNDSMFFAYTNFKPTQIIRFLNDSSLSKNLKIVNTTQADNYLKKFSQVYNWSVIHNKMKPSNK